MRRSADSQLSGSSPLWVLGFLILFVPFCGMPVVSQNLLPLPGTKPFQLLAVLVAVTAMWNIWRARQLPRYVLVFTVLFLILFTLSILRALPNLEHMAIKDRVVPTTMGFVLSDYVKPLIFFMSFVVITMFCRTEDDLNLVVRFVNVATVALAGYLLILYFVLSDARDVGAATALYTEKLGFHRNALGSILMIGFPFLISRFFIHKSLLNAAALLITVAAIGILFSRTAYVTLALTPIIYALVSKRATMIFVSVAIGVVLILVASNTVRQRATTGLDSGDLNQIMAGRVDNLWQPLMEEYLADPIKMVFGQGRYAIVSTSASQRGQVLEVKHVHNMYFEQIMDVGLVGLFFMLGFMALVFGRFANTLGAGGSLRFREYGYAVAVAATCYFLAGLTGRSMFPKGESSFFWVMVGIAVVIPLIEPSDESRCEAHLGTLDTGGRPKAGDK